MQSGQTRFAELQGVIRDYGHAAFKSLLRCRALGEAIVAGFAAYEGCPPGNVAAAPATGPFDPRKAYGEAAFSFSQREVIVLEPVVFGLSLVVGNAEDDGSLWLRCAVSMEVVGADFLVLVGKQPDLRIPLAFEGRLDAVFAALHREFIETFQLKVDEFRDARYKTGIGFLPS